MYGWSSGVRSDFYSTHIEDNLWELAPSFRQTGPKDSTQVVRFGSRDLYPLSHLTSPSFAYYLSQKFDNHNYEFKRDAISALNILSEESFFARCFSVLPCLLLSTTRFCKHGSLQAFGVPGSVGRGVKGLWILGMET